MSDLLRSVRGMFSTVTSAAFVGVTPSAVEVEAHIGGPKAVFGLVGLPDAAVREAKHRVRAAVASAGFQFPPRTVLVNLAPADLPKSGSAFDLPIALGVLRAARMIPPDSDVVSLGELALDGRVRDARGAVAAAVVARDRRVPCLMSPGCAAQAAVVHGADIRPVGDLAGAVAVLRGEAAVTVPDVAPAACVEPAPDLADVKGQRAARRALEVAAAGGHHMLMVGPPGVGKTMLARRLAGILPPLSAEEQLEVACVRAASDRPAPTAATRPFRSPHHSTSLAGLLGGGSGHPVPGELSLAHRGVLFLDELGEFPTHLLESLRQPLESGAVTIARKGVTVTFPCAAQVVASSNPCPCGYEGDRVVACSCRPAVLDRYRRRLAGPLLDRFDVRIRMTDPVAMDDEPGEPSALVRERVLAARSRQRARGALNCDLPGDVLDALDMDPAGRRLVDRALAAGTVTPRGYDRVRRLAVTVADLAGCDRIEEAHVAEALSWRMGW